MDSGRLVVSLAKTRLLTLLLVHSLSSPLVLMHHACQLGLVLLLPHSLRDSRCPLPVGSDVGDDLAFLLEVFEELLLFFFGLTLLGVFLLCLFALFDILCLLGIRLLFDVSFLLLLPLVLQLPLALQRVHLSLDLGFRLADEGVEHYITSAEAFFNLNQPELQPWSQLVQLDRDGSTAFLI